MEYISCNVGEQPETRDYIVLIIFSGTTLTAAFTDHYTPSYSMEDVRQLYREPRMVAHAIFVPIFICSLIRVAKYKKTTELMILVQMNRQKCFIHGLNVYVMQAQLVLLVAMRYYLPSKRWNF